MAEHDLTGATAQAGATLEGAGGRSTLASQVDAVYPDPVSKMTPEDALRFMRGVRLAAGIFRSAETLDWAGEAGSGMCDLQAFYRTGLPQVRLLSQALKTIGNDALMLEGFDAALTDFISGVINCGTPDLEFYEVVTYKDIVAVHLDDGPRDWRAMFRESVGLSAGAVHG